MQVIDTVCYYNGTVPRWVTKNKIVSCIILVSPCHTILHDPMHWPYSTITQSSMHIQNHAIKFNFSASGSDKFYCFQNKNKNKQTKYTIKILQHISQLFNKKIWASPNTSHQYAVWNSANTTIFRNIWGTPTKRGTSAWYDDMMSDILGEMSFWYHCKEHTF